MQNSVELADVIRRFGKQFIEQETLSPGQIKALYHILHCRTATLGGHEEDGTAACFINYYSPVYGLHSKASGIPTMELKACLIQ